MLRGDSVPYPFFEEEIAMSDQTKNNTWMYLAAAFAILILVGILTS
ncbi:MAG: hypothetical protein LJE84_08505 [Gammaproteobacteria bacterium]|nr:hypothetical protein [Gammaproteobacteria bacterium]